MATAKQTKHSKDPAVIINNKDKKKVLTLDSIPNKIKDKVIKCAKEGKSMWFVGGNGEEKEALGKLAHKNNNYSDYGEFLPIDCLYHSKETVQGDIGNLLSNNFSVSRTALIIKESKNKIEDISPLIDKNKRRYTTLFFDNLTDFDTNLLQGLVRLIKYKRKNEIDVEAVSAEFLSEYEDDAHSRLDNVKEIGCSIRTRKSIYNATCVNVFKPLIIIYSHVELPDWFKKEFEEIPLSPEPRTEVEQQEAKVEKPLPREEPKGRYIFQERDDVYIIQYEDESFTLKATDGLRYIHYLLEHPYTANPIHNKFIPKDLYKETHKCFPIDKDTKEKIDTVADIYREAQKEGVHGGFTFKKRGDYTEEVVDRMTKKKIKDLEDKIEIAKSTGDKKREGYAREELVELKKEYVKYLRVGGQALKFPSSFHKKPYDNILQAMNLAYENIKKYSEEKGYDSLRTWRHLSNSIQFKNSCWFYDPGNIPDWRL